MRIPLFTAIVAVGCLVLTSVQAACLTPTEARAVVPVAENTSYDEVQDLSGPAYISFLRAIVDDTSDRPAADEAMVFYRVQRGHGADVRVVWFASGCAVAKATYPAEFWLVFAMNAKGA